ncbi:MAG: alanyl-tRNA editing protein [Eubacteriales bacterium]|nr:alanyl-tRNA editing protein [Eubacteriales bacterium]
MNTSEKTICLYDRDAYADSFQATVLDCTEVTAEDGSIRYRIVLDQTLFFPEQGGQTPDHGTLNGIEVLDVQIQQGIIYHYTESPLETGSRVDGILDFDYRFSNMQQHSGEHIFSGIVHARYGYENVGFHLSDQVVSLDFNGKLTYDEVISIEEAANIAIQKNAAITACYPSAEELAKLPYRSKKEMEPPIRIVTVEGYDVCACCAPHVRRTGEIGGLKVMSLQNYKGGVRITILCGLRMIRELRKKDEVIRSLTALLSTSQEHLAEFVTKIKTENHELKLSAAALKQQILEQKAAAIPVSDHDAVLFDADADPKTARSVVNMLVEQHDGICALFTGDDTAGYRFIIGSRTRDCRELAVRLRSELSAKGGGDTAMIQGSVSAASAEILRVLLGQA